MSDAPELPADMPVHRIGGRQLENLRLKPVEERTEPPGFSVLLGGTPQEAAATMRAAYRKATRLREAAKIVASTTVGHIRAAGFDVIADESNRLRNHGRVIHPAGVTAFSDENLVELGKVFQDTTGC